jgi:prephenate dehydrogenase
MHLIGDTVGREGLSLTGRGLQDVTRLASSPAGIWKDVCASNTDELGPALDALIKVLADLRDDLSGSSAIETIFQSANHWRDQLQDKK